MGSSTCARGMPRLRSGRGRTREDFVKLREIDQWKVLSNTLHEMEEKVRRRQKRREEEDDRKDQTTSFYSLHLHLLEFVNGSQLPSR
ncbi:hypothetical protein FCV25MIE_18230 [Fagus crenata]